MYTVKCIVKGRGYSFIGRYTGGMEIKVKLRSRGIKDPDAMFDNPDNPLYREWIGGKEIGVVCIVIEKKEEQPRAGKTRGRQTFGI